MSTRNSGVFYYSDVSPGDETPKDSKYSTIKNGEKLKSSDSTKDINFKVTNSLLTGKAEV